ncbi:putative glutathione S-transferase [Cucurbitaria berberidis CBS 394.84]|uniref:Glutathione S-transferase n=1 Tax=Cucurbitaria berberidis CBS 394.84 TaxID=1168544 RepID=A0A9P4GE62_9PLEO|nr:putative glutathione S-transferase [Cucurbitaria berberidis CBS 394.84]KAF1843671.1 putative glutathione S-transferase [Cucurbitaria berberidis CBS 394.84]
MVLTLHHLGISQSERIVFLFEELGIEYNLVKHVRDPLMAPQSFKSLPGNRTGQSPFFEDPEAGITLSESGAICDYILGKYANEGGKRLKKEYGEKGYVDFIYFYNFVNGNLQPALSRAMLLAAAQVPADNMMAQYANHGVRQALDILESHFKNHKWLAGEDFTAADCLIIYSLTSQRYYQPRGYEEYPNIVRYLKDIGERPSYQKAMAKGDPEMEPLLGVKAPEKSLLVAGGIESDIWRKK